MLETFVAICEDCGSKLTVPAKAQGRVLPCPRCGVTFQIPIAVGAAETDTEDAQPTIPDLPVAEPVPELARPITPIILDPQPAKPVIFEPSPGRQPARSGLKVSERDVFGPPRAPETAGYLEPPDETEDDDVPRRKWRKVEKKTRWGTDAKPDPFTTTNPDLLRNDGWIDAHLVRLVIMFPFLILGVTIAVAVIRKLLMGIYDF
jgi:hypothetical protein